MVVKKRSVQRGKLENYIEVLTAFCDFLVVCIHTILYERHIYPKTSFVLTKVYNFPVRQNRHPDVCTWISDAVDAVKDELINGYVERIAVVLHSRSGQVLERFIFDTSAFPVVDKRELYTNLEREPGMTKKKVNVNIEEQFRATLKKLTTCSYKLKPLPEECSFTVAIEQKEVADPPLRINQPWIPVEPPRPQACRDEEDYEYGQERAPKTDETDIHPVRNVDTGDISFEMWIEEGALTKEEPSSQSTQDTQDTDDDQNVRDNEDKQNLQNEEDARDDQDDQDAYGSQDAFSDVSFDDPDEHLR